MLDKSKYMWDNLTARKCEWIFYIEECWGKLKRTEIGSAWESKHS